MEIKKVAKIAEFQHKIEINIFVVLFYTLLYFTVLLYYYTPVLYYTIYIILQYCSQFDGYILYGQTLSLRPSAMFIILYLIYILFYYIYFIYYSLVLVSIIRWLFLLLFLSNHLTLYLLILFLILLFFTSPIYFFHPLSPISYFLLLLFF